MEFHGRLIEPVESERILEIQDAKERYKLRNSILKEPLYQLENYIEEIPSRFHFKLPKMKDNGNLRASVNYGIRIEHMAEDTNPILAKMATTKLTSNYFLTTMELGRGVSGQVFLIRRLKDQKYYAAKGYLKKKTKTKGDKMMNKIYNELKILSKLHHENIIKTIDLVTKRDRLYTIMEYCPTNLFLLIKNQRLDKTEILDYFFQLGSAVSYLHNEMNIAHRDLKLENLCIGVEGTLKVVDFGSAVDFKLPNQSYYSTISSTRSSDSSTLSSVNYFSQCPQFIRVKGLCGSDPYISPEVWRSVGVDSNRERNFGYDPRKVDVWSMAIIFVAMMSGKFPWSIAKGGDSDFLFFEKDARKVISHFKVDQPYLELVLDMLNLDPDLRSDIDVVMDTLCDIRK